MLALYRGVASYQAQALAQPSADEQEKNMVSLSLVKRRGKQLQDRVTSMVFIFFTIILYNSINQNVYSIRDILYLFTFDLLFLYIYSLLLLLQQELFLSRLVRKSKRKPVDGIVKAAGRSLSGSGLAAVEQSIVVLRKCRR